MTVSTGAYLKQFYDKHVADGAKIVSSDFSFEIEGYEDQWMFCKQAPWPELSPQGEIEIPLPLGSKAFQPQQIQTAQQGQIAFYETTAGQLDEMLIKLITNGGIFNAKIYEGTPTKYLRYKRITDCFIQMDALDRDWENRSQVLLFNGTLFYHYFGEVVQGNTDNYA